MSEPDENCRRELESEKARAIVWFAVLAIIATVREAVHEQHLWNFPCNYPRIHLSLYVAPVLTNWIYLWLGYGGCMLALLLGRLVSEVCQAGTGFQGDNAQDWKQSLSLLLSLHCRMVH